MLEKSAGPIVGGGVQWNWPSRSSVCACLGITLVSLVATLLASSAFSIFESVENEKIMGKKNAVWGETSKEHEMEYTAGLQAALLGQVNPKQIGNPWFVPNDAFVRSNISYALLKSILECETFDAEKFIGIVSEGCRGEFSSLLLSTTESESNNNAEDIVTVMSQAESLGSVVGHLERLYNAVHNSSVNCYLEKEYECPQDVLARQSGLTTADRLFAKKEEDAHRSRTGIAVVAMIQDQIPLQASKSNKIEYAKLHGYSLQFLEGQKVRGTDRPLAWAKVPFLLLQMMATHSSLSARKSPLKGNLPIYDYIWSLDLDTVITDMRQRIDEAVDTRYDIIISNDPNAINSGSFLLKNSAWTRLFLVTTWLEMNLPMSPGWWENAAIDDMGKNVFISNHIKKVKQSLFNSYERDIKAPSGDGSLHPPFLVHFAGMSTKWTKVIRGCEYVRANQHLLQAM